MKKYATLVQYTQYYTQVFLKDCKYIKEKVIRHVNDNLIDYCDDSDEE